MKEDDGPRSRRDRDEGRGRSRDRPDDRKGPRDRRDEPEEPPKGIPLRYIAPFAVIAVIVLVAIVIGVLLNSSSGIEKVFIANPERLDLDGDLYREVLEVQIVADSKGLGEANADITFEITYKDDPTVLFTTEVRVTNGFGYGQAPLEEFVMGNGEYTLTCRHGTLEDTTTYTFLEVVEQLKVDWSNMTTDVPGTSHSWGIFYSLPPQYEDGPDMPYYIMPFSARTTLSRPEGGEVIETHLWKDKKIPPLVLSAQHEMKGTYMLSVAWTNEMCRPDSPYRTITLVDDRQYSVDAPPYARAGDDEYVQLSGGEADVAFDGSLSGDDGESVLFSWDFGDGSTYNSTSPQATHTYTEAGEYYASLIVTDDSGKRSTSRWGGDITIIVE